MATDFHSTTLQEHPHSRVKCAAAEALQFFREEPIPLPHLHRTPPNPPDALRGSSRLQQGGSGAACVAEDKDEDESIALRLLERGSTATDAVIDKRAL